MPKRPAATVYVVDLDIYVARRKRVHQVRDPSGAPVFHAPLVLDVLNWLAEKGITRARFTDDASSFDVTSRRRIPANPKAKD